jgi:hypothetical protein
MGEAPRLQTERAETRSVVSLRLLNSHLIPTNPSRSLEFHVNDTSDDQNNTRIDGLNSTTVQLPHVVAYIPGLESVLQRAERR